MQIPQSAFIRRNRWVREGLRHLLTRIPLHVPGGRRDIVMLSSRRSGSTWLMEALGAEPGLRTIDEPFGPKFVGRSLLARAPDFDTICRGHRLFAFPEAMIPWVERYMAEPRHTVIAGPYNPLRPRYHLLTRRRLWKIIHANPALEYFTTRAGDWHLFALIRHPMPTILSMSRKYEPELGMILENEAFMERWLDAGQRAFFEGVLKRGDRLELFTAEWALEQLVPHRLFSSMEREVCPVVSYEELRIAPQAGFAFLAAHCELERLDRILAASRAASASTADDRLGEVAREDARRALRRWQQTVDAETEQRLFGIIEKAGVDYYAPGRLLPTERWGMGWAEESE